METFDCLPMRKGTVFRWFWPRIASVPFRCRAFDWPLSLVSPRTPSPVACASVKEKSFVSHCVTWRETYFCAKHPPASECMRADRAAAAGGEEYATDAIISCRPAVDSVAFVCQSVVGAKWLDDSRASHMS